MEFEKASGAILSRNMKCLVLGLGNWSDRQSWVLDYLPPVKEIKVFGIWITSSYPKLLSMNWSRRVDKFRRSVYSWTGRVFANIRQKVEVLNCFALSRIFYVASVLPITKTALKNINSIIGEFIWRKGGRVLRIAHDDIINTENRGGLALLDTETMCNSLLVSQTFRLMKSSDLKSQKHLDFWMSDFFKDIWTGPGNFGNVVHYESSHFNMVADTFVKSKHVGKCEHGIMD